MSTSTIYGSRLAHQVPANRPPAPRRAAKLPTVVLLLGAAYCLLPILWVITAASKTNGQLFSSFTLAPGTALVDNVVDLSEYQGGVYWQWILNTALYAGVGAVLSTVVSGLTGYTLAKYRFPGRSAVFNVLLAGVLVPTVVLAIPQYLLLAKFQLTDTYWSVLLPSILSPYGIYLARIYAAAAIPDSLIEAARTDGAGEVRIVTSIATPAMVPGLVTVFLFQFVAIWNNFLLPFIMLTSDRKFPVTVGLYTLLNQGNTTPVLYTLVITGALLSILPLVVLFLTLQRYWRVDLLSGAVKG
ncbi:carbohydrate ABC transporter permease [Dactylosporangium sp. NPDC050588]|uniref:carbohydrate ABC transporter permease n=1 Tax=Dactylosporangium sp. NPDC050588 TaxID=3157211 RepID=UPI0033D6D04B